MKKLVSIAAIVAFLFSVNVNAAPDPKAKKKEAKTEKSCTTAEKKECSTAKKACCASKKAEEKK
ncbi:hypothetical protein L1S35_12160 [Flavobacterium sp. AS60]|uniref:hypothetical protein n=1 Tax=Flavobacterium anseongense TaxID=2910677 RepID=UPI001F480E32|nr:hypothetical protein [Flavobacterium sp. AS60]MCF6130430.1 hypothetical protein [Flavobacterium sp. AS60]